MTERNGEVLYGPKCGMFLTLKWDFGASTILLKQKGLFEILF